MVVVILAPSGDAIERPTGQTIDGVQIRINQETKRVFRFATSIERSTEFIDAIEFHDKSLCRTEEVHDPVTNDRLPPEFVALEALVAKRHP